MSCSTSGAARSARNVRDWMRGRGRGKRHGRNVRFLVLAAEGGRDMNRARLQCIARTGCMVTGTLIRTDRLEAFQGETR